MSSQDLLFALIWTNRYIFSTITNFGIDNIFQNAYLQVAVSCLEQLHVRELYDILPIEEWCQELLKNGDKSFYEDISKAVQDVFDTKPSLHLEDKIRSVFKFRKNFRLTTDYLVTIHKIRRPISYDFDPHVGTS